MNITIQMGGMGGAGGVGGNNGVDQNFKNDLKEKSPEQLGEMMGDKNLTKAQQAEAFKELLTKLMDKIKNPEPEDDKKALQDLLDQLTKGSGKGGQKGGAGGAGGADGKDNPLAKLFEALGVPSDLAQGLAEAVQGGAEGMDNTSAEGRV